MKRPNIRIVLLILILVVTNIYLVTTDKNPKQTALKLGNHSSRNYSQIKDSKWEYIKQRLFSGEGEAEFVYKISQVKKNAPILIAPRHATKEDSLAINQIIDELRTIIPNRTIDYFKNFSEITYSKLDRTDRGKPIKGISSADLVFSTIQLNFNKNVNSSSLRSEILIETLLPDGSAIQRTNTARNERFIYYPSKVWFQLNENLNFSKRKNYIQYELLRTLCYIYPLSIKPNPINRNRTKEGVFFSSEYKPDIARLNSLDKFLLQKLYEDDFLKQFKTYLSTNYSWYYANCFMNIEFAKTLAWSIIVCIGLFASVLLFGFLERRKFKYSYLDYFVPIYFIMLYVMNSISIYAFITNINNNITLMYTLVLFITASIGALVTSTALFLVELKWIDKIKGFFTFQLILKVIFTFIVFNLPLAIIFFVKGRPLIGFIEFCLPTINFTVIIAIGRGFLIYANHISQSLVNAKDVELSKIKELHAQAETKLLQSQINPHFLYNSLNSIASLAPIDATKTQKMAYSLSDLFKYSINRKGKKMSTVKDEIDMVKSYLEIEKIRFGDRLQFKIDFDETIENHKIPLFLIQPLVENAVKHGISQNEGLGLISLIIKKAEQNLIIMVKDNGPDFPKGLVSGHGLQTVYDLLRLSYRDKASLNWTNIPEKSIMVILPETL